MCADINKDEKVFGILSEAGLAPDSKALDTYSTFNPIIPSGNMPTHVVRPNNVSDIQRLVRSANRHGLNIVTVSSSAPHYKGGISCASEHIILDLSEMKNIHSVDRRNRVCMIDPGVTYGELLDELDNHGLTMSIPLAPRSGKSVLASVMDRTPSTWPNKQWDAGDPVGCIEFVFGTGDLFRTGAAGGPGTIEQQRAVGGAQKAPLGPSQTDFHRVLQGAQGTMGIVTWITVRTELKPSIQEPRLLGADDLGKIIPFVYQIQRPWLGEHSFILNRAAAAMLMSYSNTEHFEKIRDSLPEFVCLQNIAGFERMARERVDYQLKDIQEIASDNSVTLEETIGDVSASDLLEAATTPCGRTDWRSSLSGHCLRIVFLTTLNRSPGFINIIEKLSAKNNVDMASIGIYIQPLVQNHCCHVEFMIPLNPEDSTQTDKMCIFEVDAVSALSEAGAFFSRPYGAAEKTAFERNRTNLDILKKIKHIFDPNQVLNPGKIGL
jgi:FAD/FMN-containing dehydrogenase